MRRHLGGGDLIWLVMRALPMAAVRKLSPCTVCRASHWRLSARSHYSSRLRNVDSCPVSPRHPDGPRRHCLGRNRCHAISGCNRCRTVSCCNRCRRILCCNPYHSISFCCSRCRGRWESSPRYRENDLFGRRCDADVVVRAVDLCWKRLDQARGYECQETLDMSDGVLSV